MTIQASLDSFAMAAPLPSGSVIVVAGNLNAEDAGARSLRFVQLAQGFEDGERFRRGGIVAVERVDGGFQVRLCFAGRDAGLLRAFDGGAAGGPAGSGIRWLARTGRITVGVTIAVAGTAGALAGRSRGFAVAGRGGQGAQEGVDDFQVDLGIDVRGVEE